jgi:iron complex outermembrane recepter protein
VFHYVYNDYQAFSVLNHSPTISNNDALVTGAEIEFAASPLEGLDLLVGGTFLNTKVKGIITPTGVVLDTEMPNAPKASLNGLIRYAFPLLGGEMSLQLDGNFNSAQFLDVVNSPSSREGAYFVSNMRVAFAPKDNIELAFWIKNLNNAKYRVYSIDNAGAPTPFVLDTFAKPRTVGATISYHY